MAPEQSVDFFTSFVSRFEDLCRSYDLEWRERSRLFNTKLLVMLLWRLVAGKHGSSIILNDFWCQSHEFLDQIGQFTAAAASSFCKARRKLPSGVFLDLNRLILSMVDAALQRRWRGHRVFCCDGTKVNLPKALKGWGFSRPSPESYYPQGLVMCLFNMLYRVPHDVIFTKNYSERMAAKRILSSLVSGDVIVYDRGFFAYSLLTAHLKQGLHAVFRMKKSHTLGIVTDFLAQDKVHDWTTLISCPGLGGVKVRLVRYFIKGKPYCLLTTLIDKKRYPRSALKELYHARWGVEEFFKLTKSYLQMENFHSKSRRGIEQEIAAHFSLITFTQTMAIMASPATRLNQRHTINQLVQNLPKLLFSSIQELKSRVLPWVLGIMARCKYRPRPGRSYERKCRRPRVQLRMKLPKRASGCFP